MGDLFDSRPLKMIPIGRPETSIRNYHYLLLNGPEERRTQSSDDL
jgi:hypothetical protein